MALVVQWGSMLTKYVCELNGFASGSKRMYSRAEKKPKIISERYAIIE